MVDFKDEQQNPFISSPQSASNPLPLELGDGMAIESTLSDSPLVESPVPEQMEVPDQAVDINMLDEDLVSIQNTRKENKPDRVRAIEQQMAQYAAQWAAENEPQRSLFVDTGLAIARGAEKSFVNSLNAIPDLTAGLNNSVNSLLGSLGIDYQFPVDQLWNVKVSEVIPENKREGISGAGLEFLEAITQFMVPYMAITKVASVPSAMSALPQQLAAGYIADYMAFTNESNLFNLMQVSPELKNTISNYLEADDGDTGLLMSGVSSAVKTILNIPDEFSVDESTPAEEARGRGAAAGAVAGVVTTKAIVALSKVANEASTIITQLVDYTKKTRDARKNLPDDSIFKQAAEPSSVVIDTSAIPEGQSVVDAIEEGSPVFKTRVNKKIKTDADAEEVLEDMTSKVKKSIEDSGQAISDIGLTVSIDEARALAAQRGISVKQATKILKKEVGLKIKEMSEMIARNELLRNTVDDLMEVARQYKAAIIEGNDAMAGQASVNFQDALDAAMIALGVKRSKEAATGATLRVAQEGLSDSHREVASLLRNNPYVGLDEMVDGVLAVGRAGAKPDEMTRTLLDAFMDFARLPPSVQRKVDSFSNMVVYAYKNYLLSGPHTLALNVASASIMGVVRSFETGVSAGVGVLRGTKDRNTVGQAVNEFTTLVSQHVDLLRGVGRAAESAVDNNSVVAGAASVRQQYEQSLSVPGAYASELRPFFSANKFENVDINPFHKAAESIENAGISIALQVYGAVQGAPITAIRLGDNISKTMQYNAVYSSMLKKRIYTDDVLKGFPEGQRDNVFNALSLSPNNPDFETLLSGLNTRQRQQVERLRHTLVRDSIEEGLRSTFMTKLGEGSRKVQHVLQDIVPFGHFLFPFFRAPMNIISEKVRRIPVLNLTSSRWRDDFLAGGARQDRAIAQVMTGTGIIATGYTLYSSGTMTPSQSPNFAERDLLKQLGLEPNALRIGDKSYGLARFDPMIGIFGMGADLAHFVQTASLGPPLTDEEEKQVQDAFLFTAQQLGSLVYNNQYLEGLNTLMDTVFAATQATGTTGGVRSLERLQNQAARMAGISASSAIPLGNLRSTIVREMEDVRRDTAGFMNTVRQSFGFTDDMPIVRDSRGRPMRPDKRWLFVSPVFIAQTNPDDDVGAEMSVIGLYIDKPKRTIPGSVMGTRYSGNNIELTRAEWHRLLEIMGDDIDVTNEMRKTINSSNYVGDVLQKRETLKGSYNDALKKAQGILVREITDLQARIPIEAERQEKIRRRGGSMYEKFVAPRNNETPTFKVGQ